MNNSLEKQEVKRDSLKKSSIFNIVIKLLTYLIPLVLSPYLYRTLTFTGVGTYTYQSAYVNYFMLIAAFGFADYGTKRISTATKDSDELNKRFWSIFFAKQLLGILSLAIYFALVFAHVFGDSSTTVAYSVLSLGIISTMFDVTFIYQGIENFKAIAIRTTAIKVLNLILIFCLVKSPSDYLTYVWIMMGSNMLSALVMFVPLRKYIKKPVFEFKMMLIDFKKSLSFFLASAAVTLYTTLKSTILGLMVDDTAVGYLSSATKMRDVVSSVTGAIIPIFYSRISYLIKCNKEEEAKNLTYRLFNAVMDFVLPATAGLICVSSVFMPLYFGDGGSNAVFLLNVISLTIPITATSGILVYCFIYPQDKNILVNVTTAIAVVIAVVSTILFIKLWGYNGIGYALLIIECWITGVYMYYSHKYIDFKKVLKNIIKPFDASLCMTVFYLGGNYILTKFISANKSMVIMIILCVIFYALLLYLFKDEFFYPLAKKYLNIFGSKAKGLLSKMKRKKAK